MRQPVPGPVEPFRSPRTGAPLQRLIYVSRAAPGLDLAAVYGIIRTAHARNRECGLCGALIFLDGWFVQVLEGAPDRVEERFACIAGDPRHGAIELRLRQPVLCPAFAGQCMALRSRACLDPALLEAFDYRPGFPVAAFPVDDLLEFVIRACRGSIRRAAGG